MKIIISQPILQIKKMMDKNIKFNYQTTKDQQRPNKHQQQVPNTILNNGLDMKKIVQNYEFWLGSIISKNQHSQLYHGIDKNTQHLVAIKVIPIQKTFTSKQRQQLQNEIKFCKYFAKHKNVIPVHNTFSTTNNYYIMMEKAQGDLKSLLVKKKVLTEEEVIIVMLDIIEALRHMYTSGYMHCNVKPSNVLIGPDGAKLTDFALTRKIGQQSKMPVDSKQWTPYMNHLTLVTHNYEENNDVWALAVMMYECLHGYHNYPWKFQNYADLLQKIYDLNIQYSRKLSKDMVDFLNKVLNPSNKLSIMDLYDEPFIKMCIQRRKQNNGRGNQVLNTNGTSPVKYQSQKFGNFSADLADHIQRAPIRSNSNRQPIHQLQQLKRHVSNYQTSDSPQKFIYERQPQTKLLNSRQIIDCQVSFMRFINIVLKQDQHGYMTEKINPKNPDPKYQEMFQKKQIDHKLFRFVMIKQMLSQKYCLFKTIENVYHPENPFNIRGIEEFLSTHDGKDTSRALRNKLNEYDEKYALLEKQMIELIDELNRKLSRIKPQWRSRDILTQDISRKQILPILGIRLSREMCKHIWNEINTGYTLLADPKTQTNEMYKNQILAQMQQKTRRVDFLMTYYMLNCLLVDNFTDPEYFVKFSGLHIIMNNKPLKMELEHFKLVEEKLRSLEII